MTLDQFVQDVCDRLCPDHNSSYYKKTGQIRLKAFFEIYKANREWLEDVHPDAARIFRTVLKSYNYFGAECAVLRSMGKDISLRVQPYLTVEHDQPVTNGDWIRHISDSEIVQFLEELSWNCAIGRCEKCPVSNFRPVNGDCSMTTWIKKAHKED